MTENEHGPNALCGRVACAAGPPHLAGRHLDQRDALYDGPDSLFRVLPLAVRDSARTIAREHPDVMPEVVDLAKHIEFLRQQIAHISVDRDHQVRRATDKALDCADHGEVIKALEEQVTAIDRNARRTEAGRLAALGFLHAVDELVRGAKAGQLSEQTTVASLLEALERVAQSVHRAHDRAWKR